MLVEVENVTLMNVWQESFKDRETGEEIQFCRGLLSCAGEAPTQLVVSKDDFEDLTDKIGVLGTAVIDIDAQPGRKVRVRLRGME